jgi:acyl-CoA thioesterase-1
MFGRGFVVAAVLVGGTLRGAPAAAVTKIACVGASTTSGDGSSAGHHYPDELQRLVAPDGEVKNFGVSGTTMLRNVSASYWKTPQLGQATAYLPDVVIIWFGGNDAKPENWTTHKGEFLGDYEAMLRLFQGLSSHPRTYVVLSLLTRDTEGIPKAVVDNEVIPLVRQAAAETGSGVVDVHDDLADHPEYFPDGIHPNDVGTVAVAKLAYAALNAPLPDGGAAAADGDASAATGEPAVDAPSQDLDAGAVPIDVAPSNAPQPDAASTPTMPTPPSTTADGSAAAQMGAAAPAPRGPGQRSGGCSLGGKAPSGLTPLLLMLLFVVTAGRVTARRLRRRRR